jgi:hypothetical protein
MWSPKLPQHIRRPGATLSPATWVTVERSGVFGGCIAFGLSTLGGRDQSKRSHCCSRRVGRRWPGQAEGTPAASTASTQDVSGGSGEDPNNLQQYWLTLPRMLRLEQLASMLEAAWEHAKSKAERRARTLEGMQLVLADLAEAEEFVKGAEKQGAAADVLVTFHDNLRRLNIMKDAYNTALDDLGPPKDGDEEVDETMQDGGAELRKHGETQLDAGTQVELTGGSMASSASERDGEEGRKATEGEEAHKVPSAAQVLTVDEEENAGLSKGERHELKVKEAAAKKEKKEKERQAKEQEKQAKAAAAELEKKAKAAAAAVKAKEDKIRQKLEEQQRKLEELTKCLLMLMNGVPLNLTFAAP